MSRAVILLNLGSPKSPAIPDVRAYLREFLGDAHVLDMPKIARWLLLNGVILPSRSPKSAANYKRVWTPQGAPLLAITEKLRAALQEKFDGVKIFAAMRYGEPSCEKIAKICAENGTDDVLIFPQYPQFAMSSFGTAAGHIENIFEKIAPHVRRKIFPPFYNDTDYIAALVKHALPALPVSFDKLLFSFHGIPERHRRREMKNLKNDYREQCFSTAKLFAEKADLPPEKWAVSFQSRFGSDRWLAPFTAETLKNFPAQNVKNVCVICPGFTADCLETLDEIAREGREIFLRAGGASFTQIPCLNASTEYVDFLAKKIENFYGTDERR